MESNESENLGAKSSPNVKVGRKNWKPSDAGRDSAADYVRRRLLEKAHEKEKRRIQREKLRREHSESLETAAPNQHLPAGSWALPNAKKKHAADDSTQDDKPREEELEKMIDRAHKTWKKNAPLLYEFVMIQAWDTSCLTCQWLPERIPIHGTEYLEHRLLLGTYSGLTVLKKDKPRDYLMVGSLSLPRNHGWSGASNDADVPKNVPSDLIYSEIEIRTKIPHSGEVNRARYMPQDSKIVATKAGGGGGEVYLFNVAKHPSKPTKEDGQGRHEFTLRGHKQEGYGLSWNERKAGHLLSASYDHNICLWDINGTTTESRSGKFMDPLTTFKGHTDAAGDVAWHPHNEKVFGSVGDDKLLLIWDSREKSAKQKITAAEYAVNALSFNHVNEHLLATASGCEGSGSVSIWDWRQLGKPMRKLGLHTDVVDQICWSPHSQYVLATASQDRRMHLLDLSVESKPDSGDDPKELLFVHAGHTSRVSDFSWNPHIPWLILSVSDGESCVNIWEPLEVLREPEPDGEESDASSYDSEELEEELRGKPGPKSAGDHSQKRAGGKVSKNAPSAATALSFEGMEFSSLVAGLVGAACSSSDGVEPQLPDEVKQAAEELLQEVCREAILDEIMLEYSAMDEPSTED